MGVFRRHPRLAGDRRPPLDRTERVLAWAVARIPGGQDPAGAPEDAGTVVVTNLGLWLPAEPDRLGWHRIHKAVWSGRVLTITPSREVSEADGFVVVADRPAVSYLLLEPGEVPHQVRARVTKSVAYSRHDPVPGGGGVRVVARRVPGVDGLTWTARFDPGTDPASPQAQAGAAELVALARSTADPTR